MKKICLYFEIHQPLRLRRYRFFDIGNHHYYYDDYSNESIMRKVAENCYLPANKTMLKIIKEYGCQFKINFSITGIALDQMELYAPDVLESFQKLAKTGCVEFLAETYSHSLVALKNNNEFKHQVSEHSKRIKDLFGQTPKVFRNTELVYSDEIGKTVADMGFKAILTEGAKHVLGWKSPNFMYYNVLNPRLKVLLRNYKLSDDLAFRFSNKGWEEYPVTTTKYVKWLNDIDAKEEIVNIFMDYETFGEHQKAESGIFEFLEAFPAEVFKNSKFTFASISEAVEQLQPVASINVPHPVSWADEERDLTAWLGNELQEEAFNKLYDLYDKIISCDDQKIKTDWKYLQASDHFYYMCTKFFSDGDVHSYFNPYESPYDAFINYMNILSDFKLRLDACVPGTDKDKQISNLLKLVEEKEREIDKYKLDLKKLRSKSVNKTSSRSNITKKTTKDSYKKQSSSEVRKKKTSAAGTSKKGDKKQVVSKPSKKESTKVKSNQ